MVWIYSQCWNFCQIVLFKLILNHLNSCESRQMEKFKASIKAKRRGNVFATYFGFQMNSIISCLFCHILYTVPSPLPISSLSLTLTLTRCIIYSIYFLTFNSLSPKAIFRRKRRVAVQFCIIMALNYVCLKRSNSVLFLSGR